MQDTSHIVLIALGLTVVLAFAWLTLSGPNPGKEAARRLQSVRFRHSESTVDKVEAQLRKAVAARKPKMHQIAGSESRIAALHLRLHRTGMSWTMQQYFYASAGLAALVAAVVWLKTGALVLGLAVGVFAGLGLPHMAVNYLINRRGAQFTAKFPDAIDLLVRGLRSGLPVSETLGIVSGEIPGPVSQEFKLITERIRIGRTMEEAMQETADRLNMAEFNFFCITLAIQRETGGNLAETLSNLSNVLRDRAKMKLKIKAMSSESKASAMIVGSLPFFVFGMVEWVDAPYLAGFFSEDRLIIAGLGGLIWMGIGVYIMAQMVNFEI